MYRYLIERRFIKLQDIDNVTYIVNYDKPIFYIYIIHISQSRQFFLFLSITVACYMLARVSDLSYIHSLVSRYINFILYS